MCLNVQKHNLVSHFFNYQSHKEIYLIVHVGFRRRDLELNESNLSLLNPLWPIDVGRPLLQHQAVNQFGVIHGSAELLDDLDVLEVDIVLPGGIHNLQHRVNGNWGQLCAVLRHDLRVERSVGRLKETAPVVEVQRDGHVSQDLHRLRGRLLEAVGDCGGVDSLLQQLVSGFKQTSGQHNDRGGTYIET